MFTFYYNGSYINGSFNRDDCYVTDDSDHFHGKRFKNVHAAKIAITKARKSGLPASRY
jgi:hypothetical protein